MPPTVEHAPGSTLGDLARHFSRRLAPVTDSPDLEARLLLGHVCRLGPEAFFTRADMSVAADQAAIARNLLERRLTGEPMAYLLGSQGFRNLDLAVDARVLVPRPETELLVERCLVHLDASSRTTCLDLGTGSGAVALAIADERPGTTVCGVDISAGALVVARANAARLGLTAEWLQGDWFEPVHRGRFAVIAANPPYVAAGDPHLRQDGVRFEPTSALAAGPDGLQELRRIIGAASTHLEPDGWLVLEHGYDQATAVRGCLIREGFADVASHRDLAGHPRVTEGRRPAA